MSNQPTVDQPQTVGGIVPVIFEDAYYGFWIGCDGLAELYRDGVWRDGFLGTDYWPTREAAQAFIDQHADQPASGKDLPGASDDPLTRLLVESIVDLDEDTAFLCSSLAKAFYDRFPAVPADTNWTAREQEVIAELGKMQELSTQQVLKQALRCYQMTVIRQRDGETCIWSGDAQLAREFAGTDIEKQADPQMEAASLEAHAKGDYLTSEQYLAELTAATNWQQRAEKAEAAGEGAGGHQKTGREMY